MPQALKNLAALFVVALPCSAFAANGDAHSGLAYIGILCMAKYPALSSSTMGKQISKEGLEKQIDGMRKEGAKCLAQWDARSLCDSVMSTDAYSSDKTMSVRESHRADWAGFERTMACMNTGATR